MRTRTALGLVAVAVLATAIGGPLHRHATAEPEAQDLHQRFLQWEEGTWAAEITVLDPASGRFVVPPRRPSDTWQAAPPLRPNPVACHVSNNVDCGLEAKWCRFSDDGSTCSCCDPPLVAVSVTAP